MCVLFLRNRKIGAGQGLHRTSAAVSPNSNLSIREKKYKRIDFFLTL